MIESAAYARPFLSTKLNPPTTTPSQVPRAGICDLVRTSQSVKVILVRAPAGFGKTTAMVQCRAMLEKDGVDTAWMTLDTADNDASRFLACLSAAVGTLNADSASPAEENTPDGKLLLGDMALEIMDRLSRHTSPFALFLDDFVPATLDWVHIDLFAWNNESRPGRPVGGEAQTLRTLLAYLEERFGTA